MPNLTIVFSARSDGKYIKIKDFHSYLWAYVLQASQTSYYQYTDGFQVGSHRPL